MVNIQILGFIIFIFILSLLLFILINTLIFLIDQAYFIADLFVKLYFNCIFILTCVMILWSYWWDMAMDEVCKPKMEVRMMWVDNLNLSQFPGLYMFGSSCMSPGYGLMRACSPWHVPGSQDPLPSLVIRLVCLSLKSGGLFSHSDPVYCVLL